MANIGYINFVSQDETKSILVNQDSHSNQIWFTGVTKQILMSTLVVSSDSSWLTPDYDIDENYEGANTDTYGEWVINFNIPANTTTEERTATLTVRGRTAGTGVMVTDTLTVVQQAGSDTPVVIPTSFEVDKTSLSFDSNKNNANIGWTTQNIDHVERGEVSGSFLTVYVYNSACYVEVPANTGTARSGYFYLNAVGTDGTVAKSIKITVSQASPDTSMIVTSVSEIDVDYNSHSGTVTATFINSSPSTAQFIPLKGDTFCTITTSTSGSTMTVNYTINTNVGTTDYGNRVGYIMFQGLDGDMQTITKAITVNQASSPIVYSFPIWQDTDIELDNSYDYLYYRFYINDKIAYSGKAYKIDDKIVVRANDILRDYVSGSLQLGKEGITPSEDGYIEAQLYTSTDDWTTNKITCICRTWSNWSYSDDNVASHPIEKEIDYRQYMVCSVLSKKGESAKTIKISSPDGDTSKTYTAFENLCNVILKGNSIVESGKINVTHDGITDTFTVLCTDKHRYCLYFRNIWGGYDWLLCNRVSKRTDTLSPLSFKRKINNSTLGRATVQYQKSVTEKIALKTHLLSDEQAELVAMAMRSMDCYLHDLEKDTIVPVNISDTSVAHTTYLNNGRKMFNYTINVEVAQDRFSR